MSAAYLPEYVENARLALEMANREVTHLAYTHRTLFAQDIDLQLRQSPDTPRCWAWTAHH